MAELCGDVRAEDMGRTSAAQSVVPCLWSPDVVRFQVASYLKDGS